MSVASRSIRGPMNLTPGCSARAGYAGALPSTANERRGDIRIDLLRTARVRRVVLLAQP